MLGFMIFILLLVISFIIRKCLSQRKIVKNSTSFKSFLIFRREKSADPDSIEVDAFKVFHKAIENSKPYIGCQTMKKGGKNYLVGFTFIASYSFVIISPGHLRSCQSVTTRGN